MGSRLVADGLHARTKDNSVETKYFQLFTKSVGSQRGCESYKITKNEDKNVLLDVGQALFFFFFLHLIYIIGGLCDT